MFRWHFLTVLLLFSSCLSGKTADVSLQPEDQRLVEQLLKTSVDRAWISEHSVDSIAAFFIGTPYKAGTLENEEGEERLVLTLQDFDCLTYVENVLALHRLLKKYDQQLFPIDSCVRVYPEILQQIRYRDGLLSNYTSRLHYTTEWLQNNQQKGYIRMITELFGSRVFPINVHYMSSHPDNYVALKIHPEYVSTIATIESQINKTSMEYIPKEQLRACIDDIPSGSILAITTTADGLDIGHLGFVYRQNGEVYLLHASSSQGKVVVSDKRLIDYLVGIKRFSGVMVAKIL